MKRRSFLTTAAAFLATELRSDGARGPTVRKPNGYPSVTQIADQFSPKSADRQGFYNRADYGHLLAAESVSPETRDTQVKDVYHGSGRASIPLHHVAADTTWRIDIDTFDIALGFKHLIVSLSPSFYDKNTWVTFQAYASNPPRLFEGGHAWYTYGQIDYSAHFKVDELDPLDYLSKDSVLFGEITYSESQERSPITFQLTHHAAMNFMSRAAQITLALDDKVCTYSMLAQDGPNSNSYARTVLEAGLGADFDIASFRSRFRDLGWRVPGFERRLPVSMYSDPALIVGESETATDFVNRIISGQTRVPSLISANDIAQHTLVRRMLTPLEYFDFNPIDASAGFKALNPEIQERIAYALQPSRRLTASNGRLPISTKRYAP